MSLTISTNMSEKIGYANKKNDVTKNYVNCIHETPNPEETEQKREPEPAGKKSAEFRQELINKYHGKYNVIVKMNYSYSLKKEVPTYYITVNSDVDLKTVKKELGIRDGIIVAHNGKEKYGQYGTLNNGHYVEDGPMKGETFHIPVEELGYEIDERPWYKKLF